MQNSKQVKLRKNTFLNILSKCDGGNTTGLSLVFTRTRPALT